MIDTNDLTQTAPAVFVTEASTLGLKPGDWPSVISSHTHTFLRQRFERLQDELIAVHYIEEHGTARICVLND